MVGGGWLLLDVVVWCWVLVVACAVVWLCVLRVVGGCLVVVGCCWRLLCEVAHCRVLVGMCLLSSIGWRAVACVVAVVVVVLGVVVVVCGGCVRCLGGGVACRGGCRALWLGGCRWLC